MLRCTSRQKTIFSLSATVPPLPTPSPLLQISTQNTPLCPRSHLNPKTLVLFNPTHHPKKQPKPRYTESSPEVRPIGLREPKYSPFGPGKLIGWTGVCAPVVDPKVGSPEDEKTVEEKRRVARERIQGEPLTNAERKALVERCQRHKTKRQVNLGRDGLTHNMLNDIHNNWKHAEAVRIKCMGVPTVDMKNVCTQLERKELSSQEEASWLIPLMLWKPHEPVYPRLIKPLLMA
ncbi:hypothetical protein HAX54_033833 [Datura stramonium]|uniref:CRM domain-containing protein n=1 Tax=Datura stramonium TaxID=4076 RepID=A0ABS8VGH6_DATST|nr:hypothetical protein [Datura stramonium]